MSGYDISGKTAIVTGASSGIGAATARALMAAGVKVAGGARRTDRLETDVRLALGRYPFDESSEGDETAVFNTNVNGLVRMTRLCLPHIHDYGHIVNMGSV